MAGKTQRHWCVIPKHEFRNAVFFKQTINQRSLGAVEIGVVCHFIWNVRYNYRYTLFTGGQIKAKGALSNDGFLNEEYASLFCPSAQQMLWPLVNKVPSKVRQAD